MTNLFANSMNVKKREATTFSFKGSRFNEHYFAGAPPLHSGLRTGPRRRDWFKDMQTSQSIFSPPLPGYYLVQPDLSPALAQCSGDRSFYVRLSSLKHQVIGFKEEKMCSFYYFCCYYNIKEHLASTRLSLCILI